jgi:ABC-type multidrug transport system ATPase subunit
MRRKISFILQEDLFLESPSYTVRDHLSFFSALKSCSKMKATDRASVVDSLTTRLGINHLLDIPIDFLSGGEQKRVSICAGLLGEGKILLIDEGTRY